MKAILLVSFILATLIIPVVSADVPMMTTTNVYFEKNGVPYEGPVNFTIDCYGYLSDYTGKAPAPGYTPEKVFDFSASVQKYGDVIEQSYYFNYRHIDYCNVIGKTKDGNFSIMNLPDFPVNLSACQNIVEQDNSGIPKARCELRLDMANNTQIIPTPSPEPQPEPTPTPEPVHKNFWESISCFFNRLFGKSC